MERPSHSRDVETAFARQAQSFATSQVANSERLLTALLAAAQPSADQRWLDAACGPGIITRALARHAGHVLGVDTTAEMVSLARETAAVEGLDNAGFRVADATATGCSDASFDGAVTRFAIHHIPAPDRLFAELARVVRPDGRIVVLDHVADEQAEARSWVQEVERLRDPSHWASLSPHSMCEHAAQAGLRLIEEQSFTFELDFEDWLRRGTADSASTSLLERALHRWPGGTERFAITGEAGRRTLRLQMWLGTWTVAGVAALPLA
jgi:ubiquinone/menaquinone biosynthesis C-methylase UbiE